MKNSRERFLQAVRDVAEYWANVATDKESAARGTAFSIMSLLDGVTFSNLDGYTVIDNDTGQRITDDSSELHADL